MLELNKIYNEDCLIGMKNIDDKSVDMILCDLPYGTTRLKWDSVISLDKLWEQYSRIIKDNGAIVLFGNEPFSSLVRSSNFKLYKYDWKWIKKSPTGFLNSHYRPMLKYEDVLVFSKATAGAGGKNSVCMIYNPQGLEIVEKKQKNRKATGGKVIKDTNNIGDNNILNSNKEYIQKYIGYPSNILEFDVDKNTIHPTQKPVSLLEYLIKTYSNKDNLILDNCIGSGSTAIACINTNRNYIGFEMDNTYYELANKRIKEHKPNEL